MTLYRTDRPSCAQPAFLEREKRPNAILKNVLSPKDIVIQALKSGKDVSKKATNSLEFWRRVSLLVFRIFWKSWSFLETSFQTSMAGKMVAAAGGIVQALPNHRDAACAAS
ncbi:hypothetical protein [Rhizobium ruizarguesonis]|uniref:hypothetical protein n=1 Tax=Rhizobium ruizarguesonis TaxID=2081791 RepID=UPI001030F632|nr:hypothetical protein [Rhizobium ruizarguesonis]TAT84437.1 hypothetical protein ELI52_13545 [Rhizobium ruizarguesonis]TAU32088.1 hypothetical protein ELI47_13910 [Rhizobium ruizarguesonis]TAW22250.1 hypothetical protein ELI20_14115 [Rhizobium ruizarguesonis]